MASWLERLENITLEIKTGDGKTYKPLWKEASREVTYNNESFNFINKAGTYVERKERQGYQYPFVFYFQGENHLELAAAFDLSAQNKSAWEITHPYYGAIKVQPVSLKFDNTQGNNTIVSGTLIETISIQQTGQGGTVEPIDAITSLNAGTGAITISGFATAIIPGPATAGNAMTFVQRTNSFLNICAKTGAEMQTYNDLVRVANGSAGSIINDASRFATDINNLINFPFQSSQDIQIRVRSLADAYLYCYTFAFNSTVERLKMFETIGGQYIGAMCTTAISGTYTTRSSALKSIDLILSSYKAYTDLLNDLEPDLAANLDIIVNTTTGYLLEIAFNAKQERTIFLATDSNIVNLAFKYFGGDLEAFLELNQIKVEEFLQVPAGREITYLV